MDVHMLRCTFVNNGCHMDAYLLWLSHVMVAALTDVKM